MSVCMSGCQYVCQYVCVHVCVCMYIYMYVCVCTCMYVCVYVCMCVCVRITTKSYLIDLTFHYSKVIKNDTMTGEKVMDTGDESEGSFEVRWVCCCDKDDVRPRIFWEILQACQGQHLIQCGLGERPSSHRLVEWGHIHIRYLPSRLHVYKPYDYALYTYVSYKSYTWTNKCLDWFMTITTLYSIPLTLCLSTYLFTVYAVKKAKAFSC